MDLRGRRGANGGAPSVGSGTEAGRCPGALPRQVGQGAPRRGAPPRTMAHFTAPRGAATGARQRAAPAPEQQQGRRDAAREAEQHEAARHERAAAHARELADQAVAEGG
jgi:hypothetical protein